MVRPNFSLLGTQFVSAWRVGVELECDFIRRVANPLSASIKPTPVFQPPTDRVCGQGRYVSAIRIERQSRPIRLSVVTVRESEKNCTIFVGLIL